MKVIVENFIHFFDENSNNYSEACKEFNKIINHVLIAPDEQQVRDNMDTANFQYFKYGFGSSHMWVHQLNPIKGGVVKQRILIVEF